MKEFIAALAVGQAHRHLELRSYEFKDHKFSDLAVSMRDLADRSSDAVLKAGIASQEVRETFESETCPYNSDVPVFEVRLHNIVSFRRNVGMEAQIIVSVLRVR